VTGAAGSAGGAVLCGGRSERFGRDKALIDFGGRPLAEHVGSVLESAGCRPVVFVGGDGRLLTAATGRDFVADMWPGEGPLGGVIAALQWFGQHHSLVDGVVVAACDLPKLTVAAVGAVARGGGAAAVANGARLHPALAYWPIAAVDQLELLFGAGVRSLHEALDALAAERVLVEEVDLHNVNRPGDLGD
jgi:molybdenum cofactor guanylyltransferase